MKHSIYSITRDHREPRFNSKILKVAEKFVGKDFDEADTACDDFYILYLFSKDCPEDIMSFVLDTAPDNWSLLSDGIRFDDMDTLIQQMVSVYEADYSEDEDDVAELREKFEAACV